MIVLALVAITVFVIALMAYALQREQGIKPSFYQSTYEPAIRMACGQPFGIDSSKQLTDQMRRFLNVEQQTLACEEVPPPIELKRNPAERAWYYLFLTAATIWKVTGISWPVLEGLAAALLALAAVMVFAMFRLLMPSLIAAALSIVSIVPALFYLPYLRDLSKAPFVLAGLFAAVWLVVRTPTRSTLFLAMAILGLWIGVGYGFRPDVLIVLPLLAVTILFFRPTPLKQGWWVGVVATSLLVATFIIATSPILLAFANAGMPSCHWHFGLLGLSDLHSARLGMAPTDYSWLSHYMDELVWLSVESYGRRVYSLANVGFCYAPGEFDRVSRALYLETFQTFPADFMDRGLAAGKGVIAYGFSGQPWSTRFPTLAFLGSYSNVFEWAAVAGWIGLVFVTMANSVRLGLFAVLFLAYLVSYPAFQFDQRHYYHLAFLSWLPIGVLLGAVLHGASSAFRQGGIPDGMAAIRVPKPAAWLRATAIMLGICLVMGLAYWLARNEQSTAVRELFRKYQKAGEDETVVLSKRIQGENLILTIAEPYSGNPSGNESNSGMLRIDIGGANCTISTKRIFIRSEGRDPNLVLEKELTIRLDPARNSATVFYPAYFRRERYETLSLVLPEQEIGCLKRVKWLRPGELPALWVQATLYGAH